jgi:hypothetical protein
MRIKSTYAAAELHVWETVGDDKEKIAPLLAPSAKSKAIVLHDRGDMNTMVRERFKSSVHVYLEDYEQISCDAVRLSALAGCIPIMPNKGVYTELKGINISGSVKNESTLIEYAKTISGIFMDEKYANNLRRMYQMDNTLKGWNATAERWMAIFRGLSETKQNNV